MKIIDSIVFVLLLTSCASPDYDKIDGRRFYACQNHKGVDYYFDNVVTCKDHWIIRLK